MSDIDIRAELELCFRQIDRHLNLTFQNAQVWANREAERLGDEPRDVWGNVDMNARPLFADLLAAKANVLAALANLPTMETKVVGPGTFQ